MSKNKNKEKIKEEILDFFKNFNSKKITDKDIKKIKRKAMSINFKLGELKKKFCQVCYSPFHGTSEIKIRKGMKIVKCQNCEKISRWKIK